MAQGIDNEINDLARHLTGVRTKAFPRAVRHVLNSQAFNARHFWRGHMEQRLTLRNKWTIGSIRVVKARGSNVSTMSSIVGSVAPYMGDTEVGQTKRPQGKHGVAIPMSAAAGQSGANRTRPVRPKLRMRSIHFPDYTLNLGRSRAALAHRVRTMVAIRMARKRKQRFAYLDLKSGTKGIFRIGGGKRHPKLRLIWDLTRGNVVQPPTPTLALAVADVASGKSLGLSIGKQFRRLLRRRR